MLGTSPARCVRAFNGLTLFPFQEQLSMQPENQRVTAGTGADGPVRGEVMGAWVGYICVICLHLPACSLRNCDQLQ